KMGMSMCVLGMSEEFKPWDIAVNALWPQTTIATAAVKNLLGGDSMLQVSRYPEIVADAAFFILSRNKDKPTGQFFIDEEVLAKEGITDFDKYAVDGSKEPMKDLFLD
ncbi:MAG: short chain dehydrogenase, partial [Saprospiraceae bacterium]|nr:short chain dehydrogenase [Saprospiraceae bacterium]